MMSLKDLPSRLPSQAPIVLTAVAALLLGFATKTVLTPVPAPTPTPVPAPVIQTVTALGRLEPKGELVSVSAPNSSDGSRVETLRVKESDRVRKGDIIAVLNSQPRLQAALQQSQEQVSVARAKLAQVKSGAKSGEIQAQRSSVARLEAERTGDFNTQSAVVARLEADLAGVGTTNKATAERLNAELENAKLEADRYELLFREGATSASLRDSKRLTQKTADRRLQEAQSESDRSRDTLTQQLKEARAALTRSQNANAQQVDAASATLDSIAEVRPVDIQAAEAEIQQAEAAVEKAAAELEQAYVRAPQDGTILKIHTRAGEKIATAGILDMGQTQRMTALIEVYESDVKRLKVGQAATVTSDAIATTLKGTVREIGQKVLRQNVVNTDPTANTDARIMEVRIELETESSQQVEKFTNSQVTAQISLN